MFGTSLMWKRKSLYLFSVYYLNFLPPKLPCFHSSTSPKSISSFNKALEDCRPHQPFDVDIFAPDLCIYSGNVHLIFVLGCVYRVPVAWNLRREKICDCAMVVVQTGISTFEKRHNCVHRDMVELSPLSGIVSVSYFMTN